MEKRPELKLLKTEDLMKSEMIKEFRPLYKVAYNDNDNTISFGIYNGSHYFALEDTKKQTVEIIGSGNKNIAEALLGLMNEIKKYEILGLDNGNN